MLKGLRALASKVRLPSTFGKAATTATNISGAPATAPDNFQTQIQTPPYRDLVLELETMIGRANEQLAQTSSTSLRFRMVVPENEQDGIQVFLGNTSAFALYTNEIDGDVRVSFGHPASEMVTMPSKPENAGRYLKLGTYGDANSALVQAGSVLSQHVQTAQNAAPAPQHIAA